MQNLHNKEHLYQFKELIRLENNELANRDRSTFLSNLRGILLIKLKYYRLRNALKYNNYNNNNLILKSWR